MVYRPLKHSNTYDTNLRIWPGVHVKHYFFPPEPFFTLGFLNIHSTHWWKSTSRNLTRQIIPLPSGLTLFKGIKICLCLHRWQSSSRNLTWQIKHFIPPSSGVALFRGIRLELASVTVNFKDCIWLTDWCNTNWNCSWKLVKASIEIPHHATIVSYSCSLIFPAARCRWVGKWRMLVSTFFLIRFLATIVSYSCPVP